MSGAADTYNLISRAADPQAEVAALNANDLARLHDYAARLPDSGFPGVVKAAITVESSKRYIANAGGGK